MAFSESLGVGIGCLPGPWSLEHHNAALPDMTSKEIKIEDALKFQGANKVFLAGVVCDEPLKRRLKDGRWVVRMTVRVKESYTVGLGAARILYSHHLVTAVGSLAKYLIAKHVGPGVIVYIDGRLNHYRWKDDQGSDQRLFDVYAHWVTILGGLKISPEKKKIEDEVERISAARPGEGLEIERPDDDFIKKFNNVIPIRRKGWEPELEESSGSEDDDEPPF
jgi:single-stranded DNA-binding protein